MASTTKIPTHNWVINDVAPIAIDESDAESGYGSSVDSDTTSLSSSIVNYVYENGRRYHSFREGKYFLPNDEREQDRLDVYHHISSLLLKGHLFLAPLDNPQRILDIGTGTGVWALDVAEQFPEAEVIGTDLSPIQPSMVVPNCRFEVDDAEEDWAFEKDYFDFIHSRTLAQSIRDWPKYLGQMYTHTKPGGYIELVELSTEIHSDDSTLKPDSAFSYWINNFNEACTRAGLRVLLSNGHEVLVKECENAGFVDVVASKIKQPWGSWPKDPHLKHVARLVAMQSEAALPSYGLALLTRYMHITPEQATKMCDDAFKDVRNRNIHMYNYVFHIVARKPEDEC